MYSLNMPVSQLRTKVRQEFERHRYVNKIPVVDMLLFQSDAEFQVCHIWRGGLQVGEAAGVAIDTLTHSEEGPLTMAGL